MPTDHRPGLRPESGDERLPEARNALLADDDDVLPRFALFIVSNSHSTLDTIFLKYRLFVLLFSRRCR